MMKNNTTTKKALISSVMAMILCCAMLIGTTFAWFTDTVSTASNIVKSGTLDVELYHMKDDGTSVKVSEQEDANGNATYKIFDYDKWEPGYTQVETLKVTNEGTLAFNFKLIPNIPTTTSDDDTTGASLADVIDVYVCPGAVAADSWDVVQQWQCAGTLAEVLADPDGMAWGVMLPVYDDVNVMPENVLPDGVELDEPSTWPAWLSQGESTMTIALHMRESAGNEYQGLDLGDLYLTLEATQFTFEKDSFSHLYDEMAKDEEWIYVYTGEQLDAALELTYDAKIKVMRDINVAGRSNVTNKMLLDLNGYTVRDARTSYGLSVYVGTTGDLTITGNGTWIKDNHASNMFYADGALTIMNGTYKYTPYEFGENCGHIADKQTDHTEPGQFYNAQRLGSIICARKGNAYNGVVTIYGGYFDGGVLNPEVVTEHSFTDGDKGSDDNMCPVLNVAESNKGIIKIYGGTFVNADPASGDANGPTLFLDGQTTRYEVPDGYTVTKETPQDQAGDQRPYYIVTYNKQ